MGRRRSSFLAAALLILVAGCSSYHPHASSSTSTPATSSTTAPPTPGDSVTAAPVLVAHTSLGSVGYRSVGAGPPLLMIMGLSATMQAWDPRFVDALARHHRVVIFDNAGIGHTAALSGPPTIDAMASQTSALIDALHLGQTDVLGWSMGGMIAQALAVAHPAQVNHLVLCATFPGTGRVTLPAPSAQGALTRADPAAALAVLFPGDQAAARDAYVRAILGYPRLGTAPATVVTAQQHALAEWFEGADPAGPLAAGITRPTLIADGAEDALDPSANSHALAQLIRGSALKLYPDASHAFLFQDQDTFVPQLEAFLDG